MKFKFSIIVGIFLFLVVLSMSGVIAQSYSSSNPQYSPPGASSSRFLQGQGIDLYRDFDQAQCSAGQDFVLQVAPFGCTPSVVRSDLLEEQNVPVFCQIAATKVNPLIDVNAIDNINFNFKEERPEGVAGVGFHPARAALKSGRSSLLNSPVMENIGYVVVVLEQNRNESSMPDSVEGELTANLRYDIENSFGIGEAVRYLPQLSDREWSNKWKEYGFWSARGYLRAEDVGDNSASIGVYTDEDDQVNSIRLNEGETSGTFYLPDSFCRAGFRVELMDLENPQTRAKIQVDGDTLELSEGERFLDNRCILREFEKDGAVEKSVISCRDDDRNFETVEFTVSPKVKIGVDDETFDVKVGDKIGESTSSEDLFLGYVGTKDDSPQGGNIIYDTRNEEDLYAYVYVEGSNGRDSLSESELSEISREVERGSFSPELPDEENVLDGIIHKVEVSDEGVDVGGNGDNGDGINVNLVGFGEPVNLDFENVENFEGNYSNAKRDYEEVISNYPEEIFDEATEKTYGEEAYISAINLGLSVNQYGDVSELCNAFLEKYPENKHAGICPDDMTLSNAESNSLGLYVNGRLRQVSFEGISRPSVNDFSLGLNIRANRERVSPLLREDETYFIDDSNEFVRLLELDENSARLRINVEGENSGMDERTVVLEEGDAESFGSNHVFSIEDINLNKVAKTRIIPSIERESSEADLTFRVGIEKRAIQLAPDEIKNKVEELNETIEKWSEISENLGTAVKGFKAACLSTGAVLTAKNFFQNLGGQALARQEVMRGDGGWVNYCRDQLESTDDYNSVDDCLLENNDQIENDVDAVYEAIEGQEGGINDANLDDRAGDLQGELVGESFTRPGSESERIEIGEDSELYKSISRRGVEDGVVTYSQLRDLERHNSIINSDASDRIKNSSMAKRYEILDNIQEDVALQEESISTKNELSNVGSGLGYTAYASEDTIDGIYSGGVVREGDFSDDFSGKIEEEQPAEVISYKGQRYLVLLDPADNGYTVNEAYEYEGVSDGTIDLGEEDNGETTDLIQGDFGNFKKFDRTSYQNRYRDPEVRFFETDPYKGLPSIVPFDVENGWYAAVEQTVPAFGEAKSYDDSGKPRSFYVCNVGSNGRAEFHSDLGDDICRNFNPNNRQIYGEFPGLSQSDTQDKVRSAINAMEEAARQYESGVSEVSVNGQRVDVGNPSVNLPGIQCQDFMSPKDCQLLFNVCDPVICPSSRCNLGGAYHVDSVIQSGIVGSTLLCLPNIQEGVYVPVCLTGIKAGIDGLLSVYQNYHDCLQTNLETGETVGICDEVHSIYLCEFFWSQTAPLAENFVPKIIEAALGQGGRGGGEYLGVASAWANAEDSIDYMTNYYGAESNQAFQLRSTDDVGSAVCKNFVSARYPSSGEFFDNLLEPDSPAQYHAWFDERSFTDATTPPTSQYKVFYHIYAGKDIGANYQVYLKSPEGSSFYSSNPREVVDSGFISQGSYASETIEFTAPSGYRELCVSVNAKEECGFQQVSTSFAADYAVDQFRQQQVTEEDITSERECVSGSRGVPSTISPNVQSQAENAISPDIRSQGIVRVCSTDNPGQGTDENSETEDATWVRVGSCDGEDGNLGCWLDTRSVEGAFNFETTEEGALKETVDSQLDRIISEGDYMNQEDFERALEDIREMEPQERIDELNVEFFDSLLLNSQKAEALVVRGNAYGEISKRSWFEILADELKVFLPNGSNGEDSEKGDSNGDSGGVDVTIGEDDEIYFDNFPSGVFLENDELIVKYSNSEDGETGVVGSVEREVISVNDGLDKNGEDVFDAADDDTFEGIRDGEQLETTLDVLDGATVDGDEILVKEVSEEGAEEVTMSNEESASDEESEDAPDNSIEAFVQDYDDDEVDVNDVELEFGGEKGYSRGDIIDYRRVSLDYRDNGFSLTNVIVIGDTLIGFMNSQEESGENIGRLSDLTKEKIDKLHEEKSINKETATVLDFFVDNKNSIINEKGEISFDSFS